MSEQLHFGPGGLSYEHLDTQGRAQSLADVTLNDISQRYKMQEELGAGAQATVYKGVNRKTNIKVAIKVLEAQELEDDEVFEALHSEIELLKLLSHPHIVNLHEVVRTPERIYIVQEYLGGGELFEQLLAKGPFKEDYALAIFAQIALAVDYMHGHDVVHRDLKAENLVFTAKGSPAIKLIDLGGACLWSAEEGLQGLVGTPQYVAPEVVTGYGEIDPTEKPYGKECDMWSLGVLLYVMLSKTMPFRAKEVDQLLKQVVKGRFTFKPDEKWRNISADARDLISKLIVLDPLKRLTIQQVKEHPWCTEAIAKCADSMPKPDAKDSKAKKDKASAPSLIPAMLSRLGSRAGRALPINKGGAAPPGAAEPAAGGGNKRFKTGADGFVSREQQFWYAMEISPPSNMQQQGGVKLGSDGKFQMDNVSEEMRAILEDIERKKAQSSGQPVRQLPPIPIPPGSTATPPPIPPPIPTSAEMQALTTQKEAEARHRSASETMDTLLLMGQKDNEINSLRDQLQAAEEKIESLEKGIVQPKVSVPPEDRVLEAEARAAEAAEKAEELKDKVASLEGQLAKLQAKLTAVSTLYTESMQREAVLKVQLDQLSAGS